MGPRYLDRDTILAIDDLPFEDVTVPEWGGIVRIRSLTAAERDAFEAVQYELRGKELVTNWRNTRARFVVLCAVTDRGERLFTDEDAEALGQKNGGAVDRLFSVAQRLNRLSAKDVEDLAGNSGAGRSGGSSSGSPTSSE